MRRFTNLPPEVVEQRRLESLRAFEALKRDEWERGYQEQLDRFYWKNGRCCAGCDHWSSEAGFIGQCSAAPQVSGHDVMRSAGIKWSSYPFDPGQPFTKHAHVCGAFKDDFDWASLGEVYLQRVGCPILAEVARLQEIDRG